jgi:GDSL-like Lipase/Acylhydrolase family
MRWFGIRVPFIARWPDHVPAGSVDDTSVLNICDLVPTFCRLAGAQMPDGYVSDGVDASDALRGTTFVRNSPMMWHHPTGAGQSPTLAIRDGDWKLLMNLDGSQLALYNLASDLSEKLNVAAGNPNIVDSLKTKLISFHQNYRAMIAEAQEQGVKVIVMTTNPLRWTSRLRELYGKPPYVVDAEDGFESLNLVKYNAGLRKLANELNVSLVDIHAAYPAFAEKQKTTIELMLTDGMHPGQLGHQLVAELLVPVIRDSLR